MKNKTEHKEEDFLTKCTRWSKMAREAKKLAKQTGLYDKAKKEAQQIWKEKMDSIHVSY